MNEIILLCRCLPAHVQLPLQVRPPDVGKLVAGGEGSAVAGVVEQGGARKVMDRVPVRLYVTAVENIEKLSHSCPKYIGNC